ncbi:MAG TPA: hypothetical protein VG940_12735, partial [Gemmatimonadales bacterium]|nr:hypothetical protein [Gemmatimonadales bacterium]
MPPSHTLRALFVASAALVLPVAASAQGYSTAPLTTDPYAFGSNGMPSNGNAFFQWLAQPHPEGMPRRQAVLEHTYALISRVVKERYRDGRRTDLPVGDTTTAHLFDFASRIGAIGASQVSLALGRTPGGPESGVIPPEFTLKLNGPMFTLAAEAGRWQLQF